MDTIIDKKEMFSKVNGFEIKETEDGTLVRGGYIATTHIDSGWYDKDNQRWVRDQIAKPTLDVWAKEINEGNPRANKLSVNHNRQPHVAGVMIKGSARVDYLGKDKTGVDQYGLYVDTLVDKTREDYDELKFRIENGLLDSFSIEYSTRNPDTGDYVEGAVEFMETQIGTVRTLLPNTTLEGATYASQPMNEHAIMIKELHSIQAETEQKLKTSEEISETIEAKETLKPESQKQNIKSEVKMADEMEHKTVSDSDYQLLEAAKKKLVEEAKEKELQALRAKIAEELKETFAKSVESKVAINTDKPMESKEFIDYKEVLAAKTKVRADGTKENALPIAEQFRIAGKMAESLKLIDGMKIKSTSPVEAREYKFVTGSNTLEYKGLGVTTNQGSTYYLSAAELSDVFDPVIFNGINQAVNTWNVLAKDDFSNKGNNLVQFSVRTTANATAGAYLGNAVSLGNETRKKYATKMKKYSVGVEVDGDMIASARGGPIGDVFAAEVRDATMDLMAVMNLALYAEVGLETAAGVIGFEYITDSAGNTTLYSITRAADSYLAPTSAASTYVNAAGGAISPSLLRQAKRQAAGVEGADLNNLVFFTSYTQGDMFRGVYDAAQRLVPTSSRFGFTGRPEFDGIPIFEDKDCNTDDWFLVDLETHRIAIFVPPTLEMLGKDSDAEKGFIKCYWATYNRKPNRMVQIYGCATA